MKKLYREITNEIIELMENKGSNWFKPWATEMLHGDYNLVGGNSYRGINTMLTASSRIKHGHTSNAWVTFPQAKQLGGYVTKGQKATRLVAFTYLYLDEEGKLLSEKDVKEGTPYAQKRPWWKWLSLFNTDQITWSEESKPNLPVLQEEVLEDVEGLLEQTQAYLQKQKIAVKIGGDRAFYRSADDLIAMPSAEAFGKDADGIKHFNQTLAHEAVHSTGHTSRLNRKLGNKFGTASYAYEELIAELGSVFLCAQAGMVWDKSHSASYLNSWIQALKDDDKIIFKAASAAQRATDFILKSSQEDKQEDSEEEASSS